MIDRKLKYLPYIGNTFHDLTVIDAFPDQKEKIYRLKCICTCGNSCIPRAAAFLQGNHKSCGKCFAQKYKRMVGNKINKLTIIDFIKKKRNSFLCQCECGVVKEIRVDSVLNGNTTSCGCVQKKNFTSKTHGQSYIPEYKIWIGMKMRCQNPKAFGYKYWGGRGIKLCERWQSFENFIEDMGLRPNEKYSIDRINNDGDYEPKNCRWTTRDIQNTNTSRQPKLVSSPD